MTVEQLATVISAVFVAGVKAYEYWVASRKPKRKTRPSRRPRLTAVEHPGTVPTSLDRPDPL